MDLRVSVPRYWREIPYRYRLVGKKCKKCGAIHYPPRPVCDRCKSTDLEDYKLSEEGVVESFTTLYITPMGFGYYKPYVIAIVRLNDGVRVLAQLTDVDPSEVKVGMKVRAVFRRVREDGDEGLIMYGLKFAPVRGE